MKKLLRLLRRLALLGGVVITQTVESRRLSEVNRMIRPIAIDKKLLRVGAKNDGGYLVPADFELMDIRALISPGIGAVTDFEDYFAHLGIPVFLIDKSVSELPTNHENFAYFPMFLAPKDNVDADEISLETLIRRVDQQATTEFTDLILQMDIEGAEWQVLASIETKTLRRFRIMVIEFHNFSDLLATDFSHRLALAVIEKLLEDFVVVHAHLNNHSRTSRIRSVLVPHTVELTLLRRDRVVGLSAATKQNGSGDEPKDKWAKVPHQSDSPNLPDVREARIPDEWLTR